MYSKTFVVCGLPVCPPLRGSSCSRSSSRCCMLQYILSCVPVQEWEQLGASQSHVSFQLTNVSELHWSNLQAYAWLLRQQAATSPVPVPFVLAGCPQTLCSVEVGTMQQHSSILRQDGASGGHKQLGVWGSCWLKCMQSILQTVGQKSDAYSRLAPSGMLWAGSCGGVSCCSQPVAAAVAIRRSQQRGFGLQHPNPAVPWVL